MKPKHTPGPWLQSHRVCDAEGNRSTQVYNQEGKTICDVSWYPVHEGRAISTLREANARLIAAAPEMLEVLEEVVNGYEWSANEWPEHWDKSDVEHLDKIKQLIKKATGE